MKLPPNVIRIIALLFAFAVGTHAKTASDAIITAVLEANLARNAALVAHDLDALDRILAPDFNYTHSNNFQETKETHIGSLKNGLHYAKFETSELRVNVITSDVVTLNGIFDQSKGKDGNMKEGQYLFLAVWRRAGDTWQLTSLQSALPPPKK